jgi:hypothetical protein
MSPALRQTSATLVHSSGLAAKRVILGLVHFLRDSLRQSRLSAHLSRGRRPQDCLRLLQLGL